MHSKILFNCILPIICLSVFVCVVYGAQNDHRRFLRYEKAIIKVPENLPEYENVRVNCNDTAFTNCYNLVPVNKTVWKNKEIRKAVFKCDDKYEEIDEVCVPICTKGCKNGVCFEPDICKCSNGYAIDKNEFHICNPVCNGCENGECISPNNCTCNDDYQWNANQSNCDPICKTNCSNGKCNAPNKCDCNENYYLNATLGLCVPECKPDCIFGQCESPNQCKCNDGYHFKIGSMKECEPICDAKCEFGTCVSPNRCQCLDNYRFKDESLTECEPICDPSCKNGVCSAPNECKCTVGYQFKKGSSEECEAICEPNCKNRKCNAPTECTCDKGYQLKSGSTDECVPICDGDCMNGMRCAAPNQCECIDGYRRKTGSVNKCEPICEPECVNGDCIGLNECKCNDRYEKSINESAPNICCPICGKSKENYTNTAGVCPVCADGQKIAPEDNYSKSTGQETTAKSSFNSWIIVVVTLTIIGVISCFAYRCYKNRKIDYHLGNGAEALKMKQSQIDEEIVMK